MMSYGIFRREYRLRLCEFEDELGFDEHDFCEKLALELGEVKELYKDPERD